MSQVIIIDSIIDVYDLITKEVKYEIGGSGLLTDANILSFLSEYNIVCPDLYYIY